jgi:hypothetical protein
MFHSYAVITPKWFQTLSLEALFCVMFLYPGLCKLSLYSILIHSYAIIPKCTIIIYACPKLLVSVLNRGHFTENVYNELKLYFYFVYDVV